MLTKNKFVLLIECAVNKERFHICVDFKLIQMKYVKKHGNWVAERLSSPPPTKRTTDEQRKQEKIKNRH